MIAMKSREFFVCVLLQCTIRKAYIIKDKKRSPINSKAEGKKKGWPGEVLVPKQDPTKETVLGKKKRVPTGGVWSPAWALCYC